MSGYSVGDPVVLPQAWNGNEVKRKNVTGVILGFRSILVVLGTIEGKFAGEGVWGYSEDLAPIPVYWGDRCPECDHSPCIFDAQSPEVCAERIETEHAAHEDAALAEAEGGRPRS